LLKKHLPNTDLINNNEQGDLSQFLKCAVIFFQPNHFGEKCVVVFVEGYGQWAFLDLKRPSSGKNTIKEKHKCITSSSSINHKGITHLLWIAHFLIYFYFV
jgi:hypothetical protein